jgi:hypothetical protein
MIILLSCSKKEEIIVPNNDLTNEIMIESIDTLIIESTGELPFDSIDDLQEIDYMAKLLDFIEYPFIDENTIYPSLGGYGSFDELYNHLGDPISKYTIIKGIDQLEMDKNNYALSIEFNYYSIWAVYIASEDTVIIDQISIKMNDEILYKYNLNKNDIADKIIALFGSPEDSYNSFDSATGKLSIMSYRYFFSLDVPQITFRFRDNKFTEIIVSLVN